MKHLGISGGGTKIGGLFGAVEVLVNEKNYIPDVISGISAGAILSVPVAMGKWDGVREMILNYNLNTFFSEPPIKNNGKLKTLNVIQKLLSGKPYLGKQENLKKALGKIISPDDFDKYKKDDKYPVCIVGAIDFFTGGRLYMNLKEVDYSLFLNLVNASASIPVFTEGVSLKGKIIDFEGTVIEDELMLFDGGVRDHIATARIIGSNRFNISETVSVFSRPEDYRVLSHTFKRNNILHILNRYIDITNVEISKMDEFESRTIALQKGIAYHPSIYLPQIMEDVYDVNQVRLKKIYEAGRQSAHSWNAPEA